MSSLRDQLLLNPWVHGWSALIFAPVADTLSHVWYSSCANMPAFVIDNIRSSSSRPPSAPILTQTIVTPISLFASAVRALKVHIKPCTTCTPESQLFSPASFLLHLQLVSRLFWHLWTLSSLTKPLPSSGLVSCGGFQAFGSCSSVRPVG